MNAQDAMLVTADEILGQLDEICIALQAFMSEEQRDWFREKVEERNHEVRSCSGN